MTVNMSVIRLGIFIVLGTILFIIAVFLVGSKEQLFRSTFTVKAYFNSVEGLRPGASVRLSGINVGTVSDIIIVADTAGNVEVTMSLRDNIRQFIRTDTRASIETEGLVGNKVVVLEMGSSAFPAVSNGGTIQGKDPLSFSAIIDETTGIMEYTKILTENLSEVIAKVNRGEGTIGKLLTDDALYNQTVKITRSADMSLVAITERLDELSNVTIKLVDGVESVIANVDRVILDLDTITTRIIDGKGTLGALINEESNLNTGVQDMITNLVDISEQTKMGATRFAENMEALKHNWLFKNYFEQKGYWEKAEYEKEIDAKLKELDNKTKLLDKRIEELKKLEKK